MGRFATRSVPGLALFLLASLASHAARGGDTPALDDILGRYAQAEEARLARLRDYVSVRQYAVENRRFGVRASMRVRMSFTAPGEKRFEVLETKGPAAIRSKVFQRMIESERKGAEQGQREATQISPRNYSFRFVETAVNQGRSCYVLEAEPRTKNPLLFRGRIFIDAEDYAVTRIEGAPAQNPSFWVRKTRFIHQYAKFGPFWLAVSNHSDSDILIFGHSSTHIDYGHYEVRERGSVSAPGQ